MKKRLIFHVFLFLSALTASGQTPIHMEYFHAEPYLRASLEYQKLDNIGIRITGDFSEKEQAIFTRHECRNGEFSSEIISDIYIPVSDTVTFYAFAPFGMTENVELGIKVEGGGMAFSRVDVLTPNYILMETEVENLLFSTDEIPVIGYTSGIAVSMEIREGIFLTGNDYCGLRDTKAHPKEWFGKHRVDNYLYFTVKFVSPSAD